MQCTTFCLGSTCDTNLYKHEIVEMLRKLAPRLSQAYIIHIWNQNLFIVTTFLVFRYQEYNLLNM